jgi:hypothetical protein
MCGSYYRTEMECNGAPVYAKRSFTSGAGHALWRDAYGSSDTSLETAPDDDVRKWFSGATCPIGKNPIVCQRTGSGRMQKIEQSKNRCLLSAGGVLENHMGRTDTRYSRSLQHAAAATGRGGVECSRDLSDGHQQQLQDQTWNSSGWESRCELGYLGAPWIPIQALFWICISRRRGDGARGIAA